MVLISSIFTGAKSLHDRFTLTSVEYPECSYYALMRFVSDSRYNWANLLKLLAKVACSIIVKLNNKDHIYTRCIDDTIIERARVKHIEGLSRTFDHVKGKCVKEFANLLICWSDGTDILPVVSALMSSRKEEHIIRDFDKKIDTRKAGAKRRADSKQRKPSMVYRYCKSIINFGIKAQYALMDTWFCSDKLTSDLQEIGLHSICMIKKNLKFSFVGETTRYNLNKILSALKKRQNLESDIISATEAQTPQVRL
ncbi:transposase [Holdemanella sp.]|uniref:transposase n=1 Tax=Holdemanella sp. TaxID=1971762 RepID=UPI003AF0288F